MTVSKDRISMQIEQISRLLAQLFRQVESRQIAQARQTVDDCFRVLDLDRERVRTCDPSEIIASLGDTRLLVQLEDLLSISVRLTPDDCILRLQQAIAAHIEKEMSVHA